MLFNLWLAPILPASHDQARSTSTSAPLALATRQVDATLSRHGLVAVGQDLQVQLQRTRMDDGLVALLVVRQAKPMGTMGRRVGVSLRLLQQNRYETGGILCRLTDSRSHYNCRGVPVKAAAHWTRPLHCATHKLRPLENSPAPGLWWLSSSLTGCSPSASCSAPKATVGRTQCVHRQTRCRSPPAARASRAGRPAEMCEANRRGRQYMGYNVRLHF